MFSVTATDDVDDGTCSAFPGHCSLREAILASNANTGADVIDFHSTVAGTITVGATLPHLTDDVTISGPGAAVVSVNGAGLGSTIWLESGRTATIQDLTITGGQGSAAGGTAGGGVANRGTMTLRRMVITANHADFGAGVFNDSGADLTLADSTLSANIAQTSSSAMYSVGGGTNMVVSGTTFSGNVAHNATMNAPAGTTLLVTNSTVSGNVATQTGGVGGISGGANVTIQNSTVVANTGIGVFSSYLRNTIVDTCGTSGGTPASLGHNLAPSSSCFSAAGPGDVFNPNFLLGPLAMNGGATQTHELLSGSPAIDVGDAASCPATDQRGWPRSVGAGCDIGAYEFRAQPPPTATTQPSPTAGCVTPPPGMVAWYPLNEAPGASVVDDILGSHDGAPLPGPVAASPAPGAGPIWGPGAPNIVPPFKVGGSLYFWDRQRLANVPHSPALDFAATGDFTVDAWVYSVSHVPGSGISISPIVDKYDTALGLGYGVYLRHPIAGGSTLELAYGDGSSTVIAASSAPVAQQSWQHVAVTVDTITGGIERKFYVNGSLQGATVALPAAGPIASTATLHIGGDRLVPAVLGPAGYTEIALDELEIFGRALSAAEVQAIYGAGSFGKCRPPGPDRTPTPSRTPKWPWNAFLSTVLKKAAPPKRTPEDRAPTATSTAVATPTRSATPTATTANDTPTASATPTASTTSTATPFDAATSTPTASATATATRGIARPTATFTPTPGCALQPDGIVAWWPMDETSGNQAADVIGGRNGQGQGGTAPQPLGWVAGARSFDGTDGRVTVAHASALDPGSGDFGLDTWVRLSRDGTHPIVTKVNAPADTPLGYVFALDNGRPSLELWNADSGAAGIADEFVPVDNDWHLIAAAIERGSDTGSLYLDGALVHTFDVSSLVGPVESTADLLIGSRPALGRGVPPSYLAGDLDEVELFHAALSEAEVEAIYLAGPDGKCGKPPLHRSRAGSFWSLVERLLGR